MENDLIDDILMYANQDGPACPADIAMTAVEVVEAKVLRTVDDFIEQYGHFTVCKELLTKLRAEVYQGLSGE